MFVFVDESGDSGFKIGKGSSEFLVIAVVIVPDPLSVSEALKNLHYTIHMPLREEFKFNKTSAQRKRLFFEEIRRHEISIRGFAVNKRLLLERPEFRVKALFYQAMLERALMSCRSDMIEATLIVDEFLGDRQSQRALTSALRRSLQEEMATADGQRIQRIKDVRYRRSDTDNLIQVADMVAGAIYASRARQDETYLDMIRSRVHEILDWHGED